MHNFISIDDHDPFSYYFWTNVYSKNFTTMLLLTIEHVCGKNYSYSN